MSRLSLSRLLFVVITYGKLSLWLWKDLQNSRNFFLLLSSHPGLEMGSGLRISQWMAAYNMLALGCHIFSVCIAFSSYCETI